MPVTATKIASAVRKTTMPVTRTSVSSYPALASISSLSGPCEPSCSWSSCCGMFGLQNFRQVRIVSLNQRPGLELDSEIGDPEADQRTGDGDVLEDSPREMQVARGVFEVGLDEPEQVEGLGEDHPLADADKALLIALDVARQQEREGDHPMEDEVEGDNDAPVAADAIEIPVDLL